MFKAPTLSPARKSPNEDQDDVLGDEGDSKRKMFNFVLS